MQISFSIPENQFIDESPEAVAKKIRLYAALGLYQSGKLSIGAASELSGLDRYEFLEFCKQEGVVLHTQSPDELEADIQKFINQK